MLETSNKNWIIQHEFIYVYMKHHSNRSLSAQLTLYSLTVILIFTISSCFFFKIHYRTEAVVCQTL